MNTETEPKKFTSNSSIGRLGVVITGEKYSDTPILDSRVEIESGTLCWISWPDKEKFLSELNAVIDKYQI